KLQLAEQCADIEPCAAAEPDFPMQSLGLLKCRCCIDQKRMRTVWLIGVNEVNAAMRQKFLLLRSRFASADIHTAVDLPRIGGDQQQGYPFGALEQGSGLAGSGGSCEHAIAGHGRAI